MREAQVGRDEFTDTSWGRGVHEAGWVWLGSALDGARRGSLLGGGGVGVWERGSNVILYHLLKRGGTRGRRCVSR